MNQSRTCRPLWLFGAFATARDASALRWTLAGSWIPRLRSCNKRQQQKVDLAEYRRTFDHGNAGRRCLAQQSTATTTQQSTCIFFLFACEKTPVTPYLLCSPLCCFGVPLAPQGLLFVRKDLVQNKTATSRCQFKRREWKQKEMKRKKRKKEREEKIASLQVGLASSKARPWVDAHADPLAAQQAPIRIDSKPSTRRTEDGADVNKQTQTKAESKQQQVEKHCENAPKQKTWTRACSCGYRGRIRPAATTVNHVNPPISACSGLHSQILPTRPIFHCWQFDHIWILRRIGRYSENWNMADPEYLHRGVACCGQACFWCAIRNVETFIIVIIPSEPYAVQLFVQAWMCSIMFFHHLSFWYFFGIFFGGENWSTKKKERKRMKNDLKAVFVAAFPSDCFHTCVSCSVLLLLLLHFSFFPLVYFIFIYIFLKLNFLFLFFFFFVCSEISSWLDAWQFDDSPLPLVATCLPSRLITLNSTLVSPVCFQQIVVVLMHILCHQNKFQNPCKNLSLFFLHHTAFSSDHMGHACDLLLWIITCFLPSFLESLETWKKASLFIGLPAIGLLTYKSFFSGSHHHEDEFKPYPWLRIRRKVACSSFFLFSFFASNWPQCHHILVQHESLHESGFSFLLNQPQPFFFLLAFSCKAFPWGNGQKSLFHNPHTNKLPDGTEGGIP